MLQELALAAVAWSAVIPAGEWGSAVLNHFATEQRVETQPPFEETILVEDLVPTERVSIRVTGADGSSQCVTGCVEEVAEGRIVLSRSFTQQERVQFLTADWAEGIPYFQSHWGTHLVGRELIYRGVSVIPVAAAAEIGPAEWRDWIVDGPPPSQMVHVVGPNAWHPSPRDDF